MVEKKDCLSIKLLSGVEIRDMNSERPIERLKGGKVDYEGICKNLSLDFILSSS